VQLAQKQTQAQLIAEKVENATQVATLQALGVQYFQGYWFAEPAVIEGQKTTRAPLAGSHPPTDQPGPQTGQHRGN
jgi:EAL and modified HD-GYP domain-containing signal transduction protein